MAKCIDQVKYSTAQPGVWTTTEDQAQSSKRKFDEIDGVSEATEVKQEDSSSNKAIKKESGPSQFEDVVETGEDASGTEGDSDTITVSHKKGAIEEKGKKGTAKKTNKKGTAQAPKKKGTATKVTKP